MGLFSKLFAKKKKVVDSNKSMKIEIISETNPEVKLTESHKIDTTRSNLKMVKLPASEITKELQNLIDAAKYFRKTITSKDLNEVKDAMRNFSNIVFEDDKSIWFSQGVVATFSIMPKGAVAVRFSAWGLR